MQPQGMTAIALPMGPPRLPRLSSLRCLLWLRFQFSTAYRSSWSLRPIGARRISTFNGMTRRHRGGSDGLRAGWLAGLAPFQLPSGA